MSPKEWLSQLAQAGCGHPAACCCDRCKNGVETFLLASDIAEIQQDAQTPRTVPEMSDDITTELEEKLITELASTSCERDELRAKLERLETEYEAAFRSHDKTNSELKAKLAGMVPVEDVRKLVEGLEQIAIAGNGGMPNLPRVGGAMRTTKGFSQDLLTDFRAKHPELFPKCDYVSLAFHEQEMKDLERERQYVADKLMQKGDHSLPEAVDRWVSDYVPKTEVDAAWRKGMTEAMGIAANSLDGVIAAQRILAARDARKEGDEK